MGGSSSSVHITLEPEDAEGVVFVKGIRLTGRVIDRMKEPAPVQCSQSKSSKCPPEDQLLTPQSETLPPTELLAPKLPQPPSYASALVPPPLLQESVSPLVLVGQETPTPPTSTPVVETVPSVTHTAPESVPAPVPSVQEHVDISMSTESVPPAPPAEPSPESTSPLNLTEPVPVVFLPSAETVDISPPPPPFTDTMHSPSPIDPIPIPVEAQTIPLTNDVLTAPPVEVIHIPPVVDTINIPVESSVSIPTLTLDATTPDEQIELPTTPTSEPVAKNELPLFPVTPLTSPTESVEISTNITPAPVKPSDLSSNLEDLLPPPPSPALAVKSEVPSVGQLECPSNKNTPVPTLVFEPAIPPVLPSLTETISSQQAVGQQLCCLLYLVNEKDLRKHIRDELQKHLQEEIKMAKLNIHKQLEKEKAKAEAEARAKAQQQIQEEVQKILEKEQLVLQQTLKDAIIQDAQLASQYYIKKLEKKEIDLAKRDLMYKEQIAQLEEKTAKLTRFTAISFKKGLEETQKRFKRCQMKPVCLELQSKILKCYLQNTGQTLTCSNIASLYVKCVNNAKQNKKVSTGG
ncbi:coiled-coil-helix-coiled-coil-helix domain containing 3b isoform X2 [Tachysurus fulvidraco]|uniref:coiled-coil-helix-coiled-coil-helix domain containing 3b isoform X2 n=1 Tax=Tachysurus fulvidraco TaxID=1234273 RepID=UPI001FF04A70|nr:coiled-coil-helix-coiled-coil-helix domain containing 3b isoform X2 [Tachysurus fulvidraco]